MKQGSAGSFDPAQKAMGNTRRIPLVGCLLHRTRGRPRLLQQKRLAGSPDSFHTRDGKKMWYEGHPADEVHRRRPLADRRQDLRPCSEDGDVVWSSPPIPKEYQNLLRPRLPWVDESHSAQSGPAVANGRLCIFVGPDHLFLHPGSSKSAMYQNMVQKRGWYRFHPTYWLRCDWWMDLDTVGRSRSSKGGPDRARPIC